MAAATAMEGQQLAVAVRRGKECLAWVVTYGQDPDGVDGELVGLCVTHLGRLFLSSKIGLGMDGTEMCWKVWERLKMQREERVPEGGVRG